MSKELIKIIPEIMLLALALIGQLIAVFSKKNKYVVYLVLAAICLIAVLIFDESWQILSNYPDAGLGQGIFGMDASNLSRIITLAFTFGTVIFYQDYIEITGYKFKIEFITLMLLSTLGIWIAVSADNLLSLFCGLEMQALPGYALAAFNNSNSKSSEAGLKYFILGALASCLTLFGMSFTYGFSGSLDYSIIKQTLNNGAEQNIGLIIGVTLIFTSIIFKLSAAPMHVWAPDVYEGAPIPAVNFFATAQKIGTLLILIHSLHYLVGEFLPVRIYLFKVLAALSMLIGAFGGIRQNSLKRLMAYSTVLNMGYILMAVSLNDIRINIVAVGYMLIYIISVNGFFVLLLSLLGQKSDEATFEDIKGAGYSRKAIAGAISIIMFSNIGLPPLAGFFGKYFIFYQAIAEREFILAILGILTSVVASFYYLKVVKVMYFTDKYTEITSIPTRMGLLILSCFSIAFILCFSLFGTCIFWSFVN